MKKVLLPPILLLSLTILIGCAASINPRIAFEQAIEQRKAEHLVPPLQADNVGAFLTDIFSDYESIIGPSHNLREYFLLALVRKTHLKDIPEELIQEHKQELEQAISSEIYSAETSYLNRRIDNQYRALAFAQAIQAFQSGFANAALLQSLQRPSSTIHLYGPPASSIIQCDTVNTLGGRTRTTCY